MHTEIVESRVERQTNHADAAARIAGWAEDLGFQQLGITDTDLSAAEAGLLAWLAAGCHGDMDYMARHGVRRARPSVDGPQILFELVGKLVVILGALFRRHSFHCRTQQLLVTLATRFDETDYEVCS